MIPPSRQLPAALRLLQSQPDLTPHGVGRRLNMPEKLMRKVLQEGERAGLLTAKRGPLDPEWGTRPRRYRPAVPTLPDNLRRAFSAVYAFPGIAVRCLADVLGYSNTHAARLLIRLERLGLIVSHLVSAPGQPRRRLCLPALWVLA